MINRAWSSRKFTPRMLNDRWSKGFNSVLALSPTRLIVGAGNTITSYRFGYNAKHGTSIVAQEGVYTVFPSAPDFDITGIEFLPDGGKDETLLVSNHIGKLVRVHLPRLAREMVDNDAFAYRNGRFGRQGLPPLQGKVTAQYNIKSDTLKVLKVAGNIALALSLDGTASIVNTSSPWIQPTTSTVGKKSWTAHVETGSSSPYVAIGTNEHVVVHSFAEASLSDQPSAILGGRSRPTPVYCVGAFIPGGNPNIIASGWYDGKVRVYDLRSSQRTWLSESSSASKKTALAPVMTLSDPWRSFDPVYSLAARGRMEEEDENERSGNGDGMPHQYHYLAAGSALHSVVCLWDIREPSRSWSVYAPGGDRSPVYALKAEGSRVWGATHYRAFVLDFAPDAPRTSFPLVQDNVVVKEPHNSYEHSWKSFPVD